jgi:hypothetical protein
VGVMLGKGDGTFKPPVEYAVGNDPNDLAVGDFNNDGFPDLAVCNSYNDSTVSILMGKGDGTFSAQSPLPTGANTSAVVVADLNGDGNQDMIFAATRRDSSRAWYVYLGTGDGKFNLRVTYAVGSLGFPEIGDVNGDGIPDVVGSGNGGVEVMPGNGDGTFGPQAKYPTALPYAGYSALGDFNGDGIPDMVVGLTDLHVDKAGVMLNQLTSTASASLSAVTAPSGDQVKATYPGDSVYAPSSSSTTPLAATIPAFPSAKNKPAALQPR